MSLTSYAQQMEDVMLWRALQHVERGCYVDIGAQHPVIDSVSKAFYERGWRGIHVEPVPAYAALLRAERPDETVLEVALGAQAGALELHVLADTGLSTASAAAAACIARERGLTTQCIQVPMRTLDSVLAMLAGRPIHWLKIDVEGYEATVLSGWTGQLLRPWILVIEATRPGSSEPAHAAWEDYVLARDYRFAYTDGLNRFYVAAEHAELLAAFAAPPNVFDDIQLTANSGFCRDLAQANHEAALQLLVNARQHAENAAQALAGAAAAETLAAQAQARATTAESQLRAVLNSRSWRLTGPLRSIGAVAQRLAAAYRERRLSAVLLRRLPFTLPGAPPPPPARSSSPDELSPRAAAIYRQLKNALAQRGGSGRADTD
ncbi:MAG: FkbM family methyltransferase [Rhodocyclaceae bacterium]